jgi:hypothetical protein
VLFSYSWCVILGFPNPVNEKAARVVAGVVCVIAIAALASGLYWLAAVLAYGFIARVLSGARSDASRARS